jgi:two-component system sensor histidine kinase VicK
LDLRRVDLRSLITSVVQMMDRMSERHPVSLAPGGEAVMVECDDQRMIGVFENILSNAIKYSPDGGPIEVSVTRRKDNVVVSVKDYGMGISSDALPHIFERGYRASEAMRTAPGLGLGLSTSAEIVKRHRGTIDAQRGVPRGTVVTVHLPVAQVPVELYQRAPTDVVHVM